MRVSDLTYQISKIINIPPTFLQFPGVINNVIIPMIFFPYLLQDFFFKKIPVIKEFPSFVLWGLAIVIAFVSILYVTILAYPISIGSILYFSYDKISSRIKGLKGKILGIIIGIIGVFAYLYIPTLINMLIGSFRPSF